ncbi:MAG: class I SAM-dependent methyltransferase [Tissierellales bacterium]|jgi:SAM-dependent methyltransferase|nr:class I SAM-dependent methyltransferase [Tissierellales bacterium]
MESCKICKCNTLTTIYDENYDLNYYHCENCDTIFQDESKLLKSKADEKSSYDTHNNSANCEGYVNMFREFIEKSITPLNIDFESALDYGCGPGPVLADLMKEFIPIVKTYDRIYPFSPDFDQYKYDLITSTEVFEHFNQPLKSISHILSFLKPGGHISIITQFKPSSHDEFLNWWYRRDETHITFYSIKSFEFLCDLFDLELIYTDNKKIIVLKKPN